MRFSAKGQRQLGSEWVWIYWASLNDSRYRKCGPWRCWVPTRYSQRLWAPPFE